MSFNFFACFGVNTLDRRNIKRRGHIVNDCIEELLYALILIRCTTGYRNDLIVNRCLSEYSLDFFNGDFFTFEVLVHKFLVLLSNSLDECIVIFLSLLLHVVRNFFHTHVLTEIIIVDVSFHFDKVYDTSECVFGTDRELYRNSITFKSVLHHAYNIIEVCTHDVHLVDVCHSRNMILVCLTPYSF